MLLINLMRLVFSHFFCLVLFAADGHGAAAVVDVEEFVLGVCHWSHYYCSTATAAAMGPLVVGHEPQHKFVAVL